LGSEVSLKDAKCHGLTLATPETNLARLRIPSGLPDWARGIASFKVTLEFDEAAALRVFVRARIAAREKWFQVTS
jgi:tetraacyldisaccharide 4'-kinase